jgi:hypothetical protein
MSKGIRNKDKLEKAIPKAKKFIFNRERATIVLKERPIEPERSLYFKEEFIRERKKDEKFLS